jgi:hypothetical protein
VAGVKQLRRSRLTVANDDQIIATNLQLGGDNHVHQPVITDDGIYWGSGEALCRIDANAVVGAPFVGCPAAVQVQSTGVSVLWGGDGDRVGVTAGSAGQPGDAALFDRSAGTLDELTDDIFSQENVEVWRERVAWADRSRFNEDIAVRDLTEGSWIIAHPAIQAGPRTDGRFVVWADGRAGVQLFAYDMLTGAEIEVTPSNELPVLGDSLFGVAAGKVAYAISGVGGAQLFVQDLASGVRVAVGAPSDVEAPELDSTGTRLAWYDATLQRVRTTTLAGLTPGAIVNVGGTAVGTGRLSVAADTVVFEDEAIGVGCARVGQTTTQQLDDDGRGVSAAVVSGLGLVATWGADNVIKACALTCNAPTPVCAADVLATDGGGTVELPRVSPSGYVVWTSNQAGDGLGQIALYDLLADLRYRVPTDYGVNGDTPVFDPFIDGDRLVWGGFSFGTSDIFTARLAD